jgi:Protein of unknown function (DUF3106)
MDMMETRSGQRLKKSGGRGMCRKVLWAAVFTSFLLPAIPAFSQRPESRARWRLVAARRQARNEAPRQGFFARLRYLPPAEQERVLANDQRFQRLPPARQEKIRENLRHWNELSPQRKAQIRERAAIFSRLSPEQRQEARGVFRQWRELRPIERRKIMRAFRAMRDLPPGERQRFLDSPRIRERFSPHEQSILRGLDRLLPDQAGAAEMNSGGP